jgi:urease accessory protein
MEDWTGYLRIECAKKGEKTVLQDCFFQGAFKIARPIDLNQTGEACLYMMNPGGGYVDGDTYKTEVYLEPGAEVLLTTQSSTKIYKTREKPVVSLTEVHLCHGSVLEYLPDPIIAFKDARFQQKTVVRMESGASFICTDIFTPGWSPDGSEFGYKLIQARMDIYLDNRLVLFDHLKLEPDQEMKDLGAFEGYTHFGSMVVVMENVDRDFLDEIYDHFTFLQDARVGISKLSVPGFTLRVLAHCTQDIEELFRMCHRLVRERKLDKQAVFLRKY